MSEPGQAAGFMPCAFCDDGTFVNQDGIIEQCPECEGQGEVCDFCGAAPRHQISEYEWSGGCWCHY